MAYTEATVLGIVKARLNRADTALDDYLKQRIGAAASELEGKGINLVADDVRDEVFLADYAVWQYQSRDKTGAQPEWLRLALRERWLKERADDT